MPTSGLHYHKKDYVRAGLVSLLVAVVVAAVGLAAYGVVSGGPDAHSAAVRTAPPPPAATTVPATTVAPTTTTTLPAMRPTTHPIHVPGGTFVVVGGEVKLKHVVAKGENLTVIANWYDQMLGVEGVYAINKSIIGKDPNLLFPGETLTVVVPAGLIPHIAPVWLADASAG